MNGIKLNKKGFTLIELLAVIVILALLVLIALPNVTNLMNQAISGAFVTEATEYAKQLNNAYMVSQIGGAFTNSGDKSILKNVTLSNGNSYTYFCMSIDQLNKEQMDKSNADGYEGVIEGFYPNSTVTSTNAILVVTMTNGSYVLNTVSLTTLSKNAYLNESVVGGLYSGTQAPVTSCATQPDNSDAITRGNAIITGGQFN